MVLPVSFFFFDNFGWFYDNNCDNIKYGFMQYNTYSIVKNDSSHNVF